jgi:hypothetical protein
MDTQSDKCIKGPEWEIVLLPLRKRIFLRAKIFVFLVPETLTYSQDLIAKKNAPMKSSQRALSAAEIDRQ